MEVPRTLSAGLVWVNGLTHSISLEFYSATSKNKRFPHVFSRAIERNQWHGID